MKIKLKSVIQVILSIGLGLGLVYWFINQMTEEQISETISSFKRANYLWLGLSLLIGLVANVVRAQRWRLMFRPIHYNPGFKNTFFSVNVMFFANLFIPRLGEVSRCGILAKYENVPVEKSIGTMIVERAIDVLCLLISIALLLAVEYDTISSYFFTIFTEKDDVDGPSFHWTLKYGIPIILVAGAFIASSLVIRKYGIERLQAIFIDKFQGLKEGFMSVRYMKDFRQFFLLTISMWICYYLMVYVSFFSLPETAGLSPFTALACLIFGSFAMVATPGGIGAYPLAIRAVLLLYGVQEVIGGALGTMIWGVQTSGVFISGIISLILLALMNSSKPVVEKNAA